MSKRTISPVVSVGIDCPIVREGDDIVNIVVKNVLGQERLNDYDVVAITESVVARAAGLYVTVDEIAEDVTRKFGPNAEIKLICPIYSRNRFSLILKGIARSAKSIICWMPEFDEVGNPAGVNPFTGVDICKYYKEICESENCEFTVVNNLTQYAGYLTSNIIHCGLHNSYIKNVGTSLKFYTLADICSDKNPDFGLLGTNKATDERLKLFPTKELAAKVCSEIKHKIADGTGTNVIVMVYGDGCFKSPQIDNVAGSSIWEFADPVAYLTSEEDEFILNSHPNEIKVKYLADDKYKDYSGKELKNAIIKEVEAISSDLKGNMTQEGCTPRRYGDLLASLCDLTSGSGSRMTPVVVVKNYIK